MPRGMRRTTIMSHGRVHDAKGVKGTHLRGTVPSKEVLDAVPAGVGTVGHIPEPQPGKHGVKPGGQQTSQVLRFDQAKGRNRPMVDAEGDIVLPGGNRTGTGMSTPRPQTGTELPPMPSAQDELDVQVPGEGDAPRQTEPAAEAQTEPAEAQDEAVEAPAEPAEAPEAVETVEDTPEAEEAPEAPAEAEVEPEPEAAPEVAWPTEGEELAEWLSKRKLTRGKVAELEAWCEILGIIPAEYVDEGESVTGNLMRELIVQQIDEDYGVVIEL